MGVTDWIETLVAEAVRAQIAARKLEPIATEDSIAPPVELPPAATPWLAEVRGRAAVVGLYDPDTIVPAPVAAEERDAVLNALALESSEDWSTGERRWVLQPDARRAALEWARRERKVKPLLAATRSEPDDTFGALLRDALRGRLPPIAKLTREDLTSLLAAAEFASAAVPRPEDLVRIRQELARRSFDRAISSVLPRTLIGRDDVIASIIDFVTRAADASSTPNPLVLTGVGGSGKSTVLSEAMRRVRAGTPPVAVVLLDFDRPMLGADGEVELTFELTRQLGVAFPAIDRKLSALRNNARERLRAFRADVDASQVANREYASSSSADRLLMHELRPLVEGARIQRRPLALVLDTFEEVFAQGPHAVQRVLAWIEALRYEGGLEQLRPIISGRAMKEAFIEANFAWQQPAALEIGDLPEADAAALLVSRGVAPKVAPKLAAAFGGNPLLLRLLADFLTKEPDVDPESLLENAPRRRRRTTDFRLGFLYDRILRHVRGDGIQQLASPGLVLRRVSPALIRDVLAGPCKLGVIDTSAAEELFNRLASHVWLVERRSAAEAFHRRDLRRIMLPIVTANDRDVALDIHRAAAEYYERGGDLAQEPTKRQVEATYHRLMAGEPVVLTEELASLLAAGLGGDVDDLPLQVRAQVKALRDQPLSVAEIRVLPTEQRRKRVDRDLRTLLASGNAARAHAVMTQALTAADRQHLDPRLTTAILCGVGDLAGIRDNAMAVSRYMRKFPSLLTSPQSEGDVAESPLWLCFVMLAAAEDPRITRVAKELTSRDLASMRNPENFALVSAIWRLVAVVSGKTSIVPVAADVAGKLRASPTFSGPIVLRHAVLAREGRPLPGAVRLSSLALLHANTIAMLRTAVKARRVELVGVERAKLLASLRWLERARERTGLSIQDVESMIQGLVHAGVKLYAPKESERVTWRLLWRGITPEFRPPVAAAFIDAFPTADGKKQLARAAWAALPVRPLELEPQRFADAAQRDPQRWLAPLIDLLDRSGTLGRVLQKATRLAPASRILGSVSTAFQRYDQILRTGH